jgi:hypothetical protein
MTLSASVETIGKVILIRRYYGSTDVRSIRLTVYQAVRQPKSGAPSTMAKIAIL